MVPRVLKPSLARSFFLFGARGTGKSTLLRQMFPAKDVLWLDLLDPAVERAFVLHPSLLAEQVEASRPRWVVIDEVQRAPRLLDMVHFIIEKNKGVRFALTGSSARKLKRGGANLLAGRASVFRLHPFCFLEYERGFALDDVLRWGTLPLVALEPDAREKKRILDAYAHTYLREEIMQEQLVRGIEPFRRFLPVAAQASGEILNHSRIADEAGIQVKSAQRFYEILEDTLLGFRLEAFHLSVRKQQRMSPKFFLFDLGVQRALEDRLDEPLQPHSGPYGRLFESHVVLEMFRLNDALETGLRLSYLQSKDRAEVDVIVQKGRSVVALVEIKSADRVEDRHLRHLLRFAGDFPVARLLVASREERPRKAGRIEILPWQQALRSLFVIEGRNGPAR
jgi:predicted AAA+ superfamily ATPase